MWFSTLSLDTHSQGSWTWLLGMLAGKTGTTGTVGRLGILVCLKVESRDDRRCWQGEEQGASGVGSIGERRRTTEGESLTVWLATNPPPLDLQTGGNRKG